MTPVLLFASPEALSLEESLVRALNTSLEPLEVRQFEDGGVRVRPLSPGRDADAFILQSLLGADRLSVHDRLFRLAFLIAALRDHGAARITAVTP